MAKYETMDADQFRREFGLPSSKPTAVDETLRILAIDPASRCGFAHSLGPRGVWELGSGPERLNILAEKIRAIIAEYQTLVIAYEAATFGSKHIHVMRRHNEMAGVIEQVAAQAGLPCWSYPPSQWKARALGAGRATKAEVIAKLWILYRIDVSDDDEADAIGILYCAKRGAPPESKKKAAKRVVKALKKKQPRLFK